MPTPEELARQNIQSRLRGNILMSISNAEGRLLLSTGNKSELALGYCTLYGDTNGGLAVIGDVLKTEVYALARHIDREGELIPWAVINKRPSAELAPDQFDDQTLPPYDVLDPILQLYFERKASPEEIIAKGHDPALVYDILNRVESPANEFKRRQLPPTLIISRHAIGIGRRRPITHRYRRQPPTKEEGAITSDNTLDWLTRIKIKDPDYGEREALVHLNAPYDYRGYRLFQASFSLALASPTKLAAIARRSRFRHRYRRPQPRSRPTRARRALPPCRPPGCGGSRSGSG